MGGLPRGCFKFARGDGRKLSTLSPVRKSKVGCGRFPTFDFLVGRQFPMQARPPEGRKKQKSRSQRGLTFAALFVS
jgi:hypothetical protein